MSEVCVGNDVVDLGRPRTEGRSRDERFVARVFDSDERAAISAAADADLELWTRWAAKEAGFKVVSKLVGTPPPFVHRAFRVAWSDSADEPRQGEVIRRGRVTWEGREAPVSVALCAGGLHAVAYGPSQAPSAAACLHPRVERLDAEDGPWSGPLERLEARLTERERDAVYSLASAAVRLGARADLARTLKVAEERLEIVCEPGPTGQRPPRVLLDGRPGPADVSLSHDGRWIAWVLWIPTDTEKT